ncbi:hypothetical protein FB451DRAFT_302949 [Mycena latifolia]|nr:hypothetical protein FB451DRAFT_302949 [Mycena latifolia]
MPLGSSSEATDGNDVESIACPRCGFPESALKVIVSTSPCPEFLRSNVAPPDSEYAEIRGEIATARSQIGLIDEKMGHLQQVLDELAAKSQELEQFVADHQRVIAPIRKLPIEILSEIFLQCVEWGSEWNPFTDPQWALVRVCRYWRTAALSTPRLWRHIFIHKSTGLFDHIPYTFLKPILPLQLKRSAEAPLALSLTGSYLNENTRIYILEKFFSVARRWQDVTLRLSALDVRRFQAQCYSSSFPALTRLDLTLHFIDEEYALESIFQSTPLLEELNYGGTIAGDSRLSSTLQPICAFPLPQLKKLALTKLWYKASDIVAVFQASNVVEVSFRQCYHRSDGTPPIPRHSKTLPNLESFTIDSCDDTLLSLYNIVAPALKCLSVSSRRSRTLADDLISLLTRSTPSLTHLTVRNVSMPGETVLKILSLVPTISSLVLYRTGCEVDWMKVFTCRPGGQNLVPQLVSLELEGEFGCEIDEALDMLKSRCAPGPLRFFRFRAYHAPHDLNEIIRTQGLDVRIE